ncbi:hypothetical protein CHS0354_035417 [Potamilus streckersoni]|uniref:FAD-binding FR-type domain-containing protein n=1 Tax=Potamilus streckersoni TaxID=2493646 RepID=A0AAE0WBS4_9BIVA|nr:hypothetical protein CHS0354_035417 [Potamilus streckersoni]
MGRLLNDIPRWIVIAVWIAGNIGMFVYTYFRYMGDEFYYLRLILGEGLPVARAGASCLNLNCMLILLPVCRNLTSFSRGSLKRCCNKTVLRQLDKQLTFHRYIAYMICLHTAIHLGAHVFNAERFLDSYSQPGILSALSLLPTTPDGTFINFIRTAATDPIREMCKTTAGVTGIIITLVLILMMSSSTETIRRSYFEVFWFTHHLFVVFFIGASIHGLGEIVRYQTNIDVHNPHVCKDKYTEWGKKADDGKVECPLPQFAGSPPQFWKWCIGPVVFYLMERGVRFYRSMQQVVILKVVKHPSNVFELQMRKKGFTMGPGQYIFIKCPTVSHFEWHPFTLTSAPDDDYFSVHIRQVGNWTNAVAKAVHVDSEEVEKNLKLPRISVDGPFGTATEDIFNYEVDVFIAAGIGVTPFASVLRHIWFKETKDASMELKKVYFYWICPDLNSFEWLHNLLREYDTKMAESGKTNFLSYFIYLTQGWDKNLAKNIVLHENEEFDPITGLQQKTHYGRPNWNKIFPAIAEAHPEKEIGVFFCGPKGLSKTLHKACNQHSKSGTKFYYNKESF